VTLRIEACAYNGLCLTLAETPSPQLLDDICWLVSAFKEQLPVEIIDIVPAYVTITVYFDFNIINRFNLRLKLIEIYNKKPKFHDRVSHQTHQLAVWYDAGVCPDLRSCAEQSGMSVEEIVATHTGTSYRVYGVGFAPGFAYLGDLPQSIRMSRHATPRLSVPKGAVAIAEGQTAVYPLPSPGGWQVLGLCSQPMLDSNWHARLQVGDEVRFYAIDRARYLAMGGIIETMEVQ